MVNVMTYEALYDTLRREKTRNELQKLPDNFFGDVAKYLIEKKSILESQDKKDSVFASKEVEKTKMQIKNSKLILNELIEKREFKIMQLALSASKTNQDYSEMLSACENDLYNNIRDVVTSFRSKINDGLNNSKKIENKMIKLKFLENVPEFIGENMQKYGPFEPGNEAEIPPIVANILLEKKNATFV